MMAPKTNDMEKVLHAFLDELKTSIGTQMTDLKGAVTELNKKIETFNVQLIDERIKNLDKDLSGYGNRLKQIEEVEIKKIKDEYIDKLNARMNTYAGGLAVMVFVVPIIVAWLMSK